MSARAARAWLRRTRAIAFVAFRQASEERPELLGRIAFFAVILLVFSRLFAVAAESGLAPQRAPADLVWYLALTEWVLLSIPMVFQEIEQDVRSGDVAYHVARPVPYLTLRVAAASGALLLRLAVLGAAGTALTLAIAGSAPSDPRGLLLALPLGIAAAWLGLWCQVLIGFSAFWLHDCSPLYWIWQKCVFILGGLMLPLEVYPDALRLPAEWTPFAAMLSGVGRQAFGFDAASALRETGLLALWGAIAFALARGVQRRALRALEIGGG